ncbi:hypothetical protein FF2_027824 [Malus domestica]
MLHLHQILDGGESVVSGSALVRVRLAFNLSGVVSSGFISLSELEPFEVLTKNFIVFFTCTIRLIHTVMILRKDSDLRFPSVTPQLHSLPSLSLVYVNSHTLPLASSYASAHGGIEAALLSKRKIERR